ncbi:DNA-3-methyladenine glycosylase family protein [Aquibacillus sediminis]|uniref:DNA-3-methyladenine glycosylase family protein n=1 Tax=Aquibacillus sediminis TaxID=2574734 RepID=UPI0011097C9B|nr:DNA-3-methyladenine glycosylase [Aquibacillus sediminis]
MWTEKMALDTIYDFDYVLKRLAMDPLHVVDLDEKYIYIPVLLPSGKHVVRLTSLGTTTQPVVELASDSLEEKSKLIDHVFDLFRWQVNLSDKANHFKGTNLESLFIRRYPGTPVVKEFHPYASLMKTIIHQQLNMAFAHTLTRRFVEQYGSKVEGVWFYPTPEEVASISYEDLRQLQFSQRKAEYVINTSRLIVDGELNLEQLAQESDEQVMKTLVKIRGIGNWTAENWLLFGAGREDLLPKKDIGIQNALKHYFGMDRKPTLQEIDDMSKEWMPFRSYATLILWRTMEERQMG